MANMIPATLPANLPPGEVHFYRSLAEDLQVAADWTVLCRVELVNTSTTRERELDFIVLVPYLGVLVVEIKSHQAIERSRGEWLYGFNRTPGPNPMRDTNDRKHHLRRALRDIDSRIADDVPVGRLVIFTHAAMRGDFTTNIDWHPYELLDANRYAALGATQSVINALEPELNFAVKARGKAELEQQLGPAKMKSIAQILCPDFVGLESAGVRTRFRDEELVALTNSQADALHGLRRSKRVVVTGYAGTGKTTLAVQIAREYASQGLSTALLCFNGHLASHLSNLVAAQKLNYVGTAHKLALEVLGLTPKERTRQEWDKIIRDATQILRNNPRFDFLVVDEAQDYYQGDYALVDLLDAALRGRLSSGSYRMFGDFLHQSLYGQEDVLPLIVGKEAVYDLDKNCRNKEDTARFAESVAGLQPGYRDYLRKGKGGLQVRQYDDAAHFSLVLREVLKDCKAKGIQAHEIVLLSLTDAPTDSSFEHERDMPYQIKELFIPTEKDRSFVGRTSLRKFKGLEAPFVIVGGIPEDDESLNDPSIRDALYIAVTRSLEATIVLAPKSSLAAVRSWLTKT
jgi:hypothetical protein